MALDASKVAALFATAQPTSGADYDVLTVGEPSPGSHFAVARSGAPALLVPVERVTSDATRLTHGLALRGARAVEFARGAERWTGPAAVVECRDERLSRTFYGLVAALASRLAATTKPSWETVASLFSEWERLLGRRNVLSAEAELGLWGELWLLKTTKRAPLLLDGWRGPEAERVDFLLDGYGFEVKASRRIGVHMVSQDQVDRPVGDAKGVLVSMHVMPDPIRGRSLADLVGDLEGAVGDIGMFEEKLAEVGYCRDDDAAYGRRYALVEAPSAYAVEDVPRVRSADAGVSHIRFRVALDKRKALSGPPLDAALSVLGINLSAHEYPCA